MSGSSRSGRWVASSVMEEDIAKLRLARYLTPKILHRLPAEGQVIPTPKSGERVVFVSHFLHGLGFALNPFVRGPMFYYGLDFHDLASDSILLILTFIVTCEAFLRTPPHCGLWLKTFDVRPQVTEEDIAKLRVARYLTPEILHRLPAEGQVIPTHKSGERVVFCPTSSLG